MKINSGAIQMFQGMIVLKTLSSELGTEKSCSCVRTIDHGFILS